MRKSLQELQRLDQWLSQQQADDDAGTAPESELAARLLAGLSTCPAGLQTPPLKHPGWVEGLAAELAETGSVGPGARVGPFEIQHAIGSGGMGAVYQARRVEGGFEQQVALKVLAGASPGADSYRQFQRERELLSCLEHPGIARLIDGGMTDDWRPWFAMELVDGVPIDQFARERRLNVEQRIDLFLQVCAALEYAHGRLVLHRDIKPSNLLVTDGGQVKLLDFGLGRVQESLEDIHDTKRLQITGQWLTPQFASPEQIRGEPVSVASDLYQLGLLLYRLLCDCGPHAVSDSSPVAVMQAICEQDPLRPSRQWQTEAADVEVRQAGFPMRAESLARRLRGDLDNIILTALSRNPADRYAGVADLVEDLRRHQEHRPVRARVGTRRYRLGKFVRRYRHAVSAAAAVFALISIGLVTIAFQAANLAEERNRALAQAEENARLTEVLTGMVQIANVDAAGVEQITTVGDRLAQYLAHVRTELADEPATRLHLLEVIGEAYEKLRDWSPAAEVFEEAWLLARALLGATDERTLTLQAQLAQALASIGEWDRAEALLDELESFYLVHYGPNDVRVAEVIFARAYLYQIRLPAGDPRTHDLQAQFARALEIWRSAHAPPHEDLARGLHFLGLTHSDRTRGIEYMRDGLEMSKAVLGEDHGMVARRKNDLALQVLAKGEMAEAIELIRRASELHAAAWGETHPQTLSMMSNLAGILQRAGEYEEAIEVYHRTHELTRLVADDDAMQMAYIANGMAMTKRELGQLAESEPWFREAVRVTSVNESPLEGVARGNFAGALIAMDQHDEARQELEKALELNMRHFGEDHARTEAVREQLGNL